MRCVTSTPERAIDGNPLGKRLHEDLVAGASVFAYGASTPLRNAFLSEAGHHYSWLSSLEVATQLCERDDESIGFEEMAFFLRRIAKHTPEMGVLVDCDTGWTEDAARQSQLFAELDGLCAAFVIENVRPGAKVNSFMGFTEGSFMTPADAAAIIDRVSTECSRSLVMLRLENLNAGATPMATVEYLGAVMDCGARPDGVLVHGTSSDVADVEKVGELIRARFGQHLHLATVTTAYCARRPAVQRLRAAGYQIFIVPNLVLRAEVRQLREMYARLVAHDYDRLEAEVPSMRSVIDYVEEAKWTAPPMPEIVIDVRSRPMNQRSSLDDRALAEDAELVPVAAAATNAVVRTS